MPCSSAARHTSVGSPSGSAAARSISRRVSSGSTVSRRRKLSSIPLGNAETSPAPKPASSAALRPRGSSTSARGLPRDSATIRSHTCSSNRNRTDEATSARASPLRRPPTASSGRTRNGSIASRTPNTSPTGSASKRRATNTSVNAEDRSSHCASSTTHSSGHSLDSAPETVDDPARPCVGRGGSLRHIDAEQPSPASHLADEGPRPAHSSGEEQGCCHSRRARIRARACRSRHVSVTAFLPAGS